jgi:hypothetical protein
MLIVVEPLITYFSRGTKDELYLLVIVEGLGREV